jgi:hypothetical protein
MVLKKLSLPRRTFLRGAGATLALPFLDAMVPALVAKTDQVNARRCFGAVYAPNGFIESEWTPQSEGAVFELTPILSPLAPFRDRLLVLSGLANRPADAVAGEGAGDHARAGATWLSGVHVKKTEGAPEAGITVDQLLATELGGDTQLPSLELSLESRELVGACDLGYSCAYTAAVAWRTPTMPLLPEHDPRALFERLFGSTDSTDPRVRLLRLQQNLSILDVIKERLVRLQRSLGTGDLTRLDEYLEAVRSVEHRIQTAEEHGLSDLSVVDRPAGVPEAFEDYATMMTDLLVIALQADLTRVFTLMIGGELSSRSYPQIGVPDGHHGISHHQYDPVKMAKCAKINAYHYQLFARLLTKLAATPDGEGSLLDRLTVLYGTGLGNSDRHTHFNLATVLISSGRDGFKAGRHLRFPTSTPLSNLHLSLMTRLGRAADRFGDSTGRLTELEGI